MFTIEIGGNPVAGNALMRAPAMPDPRSFAVIIVVAPSGIIGSSRVAHSAPDG
jgi:hypothetical protein